MIILKSVYVDLDGSVPVRRKLLNKLSYFLSKVIASALIVCSILLATGCDDMSDRISREESEAAWAELDRMELEEDVQRRFGEDADVQAQALKIALFQPLDVRELQALGPRLNQRYRRDITLLFYAMKQSNSQAIDALLEAGADTTMTTRSDGGQDFVYFLAMPGSETDPKTGRHFINAMIASYLKHGGDPNRRLLGPGNKPLITYIALSENYEGIQLFLDAGADPWLEDDDGDNLMSDLASEREGHPLLHKLIDQGLIEDRSMAQIKRLMSRVMFASPTTEEQRMQRAYLAKRILRHYPEYLEDRSTEIIFGGLIPWSDIRDMK